MNKNDAIAVSSILDVVSTCSGLLDISKDLEKQQIKTIAELLYDQKEKQQD
jgi:hypothetical protein